MSKVNAKIKKNILRSMNEYLEDFNCLSFKKMIEEELSLLTNDDEKNRILTKLLEDKSAIENLDNLYNDLEKVDENKAKETFKYDIINTLEKKYNNKSTYELNVLFLEYDFESEFCLCGFEDNNFQEQILDGDTYLEFNDEKELFNGIGEIDFSECFKPLVEIEKKLGSDVINCLESTSIEEFFILLREFYVLNTYKILNELFEEQGREILNSRYLKMKEKIYIYANEHEMHERNIYILQN